MIVNCPKCGFSQPKDRYCANCGVDMETYRPKSAPITSRILKSWIFQAAVLISAIVVALSVVKIQRERERQVQEVALAPPSAVSNNSAGTQPPPPPPPPATAATVAVATPAAATAATNTTASSTGARGVVPMSVGNPTRAASPATSPARAGGESNRDSTFTQIDLVYAEIPRSVLANLESASRMLDADNVSVGVYPNIANFMRQLTSSGQRVRALRVLESARSLAVHVNQPIITFKGMRDPNIDRNIGITSQIIPTAMDENGLHLQVDIQRTVREQGTAGGVAEFAYQSEMILTKGSGAFIAGLLPRWTLTNGERAFYTNAGVLKVLASPDYQSDLSEFVLFIEAR